MDYFRPLADAAVSFVDRSLNGRDWLVGDALTIADIGCWGRMVFMAEGGMDITAGPTCTPGRSGSRRCPASRCPTT